MIPVNYSLSKQINNGDFFSVWNFDINTVKQRLDETGYTVAVSRVYPDTIRVTFAGFPDYFRANLIESDWYVQAQLDVDSAITLARYGGFPSSNTNTNTNTNTNNNVGTYTVKSGDTLSKIATRYNTTWQALARLNNLTGNQVNQLRVGQVLKISGTSSANIPIVNTTQVNQVLNQNQQNTGNQTPYIAPVDNSKKPSQIEDFATRLGVSVGMLATVGLVLLVVITKKK